MNEGMDLQLDDAERNTAVWLRIREHLLARLDLLRRQNDNPLSIEDTIRIRASIHETKKMLAAGEPQD